MQRDANDAAWTKGKAAYEFGDSARDGDRKAKCEGYLPGTSAYDIFMLAFVGMVRETERTGRQQQKRPNEDMFFFDKFAGEIPAVELLALARIGAGQLRKHWDDKQEINRLIDECFAFSGRYENQVLKMLTALREYAAGEPYNSDDDINRIPGERP
jgi:hypothetical protein